jgi:UDP-3-O-[3-hydroxymyristoyl] glucosamine N-acyltransferase
MAIGPEGISLAELAERLGGQAEGSPSLRITGAAGLQDAHPGCLVRVEHPRYLEAAEASPAAALLTDLRIGPLQKPAIRVKQVRLAFAQALGLFAPEEDRPDGIHPTAVVASDAELGPGCAVGPYAVIGRRARLGARSVVHAHAVIGEGTEIGEDSVIFPQVVLYSRTIVGARAKIHSGSVIGADGFGYEWNGRGHQKIPQIGRVRIGDDVEIGANATIDRATTGETVIGPGTKVDNLVQVAHNVRTGAHCLIVSQVGIAGSTTLGNGVVLAGQAGVKDHVHLGDGVQAAGKSGVWGDQPAGARVSGHPARPHREEIRIQGALGQLPELLKRVAELERRLAESGSPSEGETGG